MKLNMELLSFVVGGAVVGSAVHFFYEAENTVMSKENATLRAKVQPLDFDCPPFTVKIASQSDGGPWVQRCVGRGKVRAM